MKDRHRLLFAAAAATCLAAPVWSQSPGQLPTFKAEVEYVEVDVQVTDERGNVVRDLRKEDFQIFEDGKSQSILGFTFIDVPVEKRSSGDVLAEPDVSTNEHPFDGRIYVLVLDDLHTAPLRATQVRHAAREFIDRHFAAGDLMAVVQVGGSSQGSQEFTGNKRLLKAAVDRFVGQKIESATMARNRMFFAGSSVASGDVPDPFEAERGFNARATTRVLTEVAEKLSTMRGRRKSIVFISEGLDYDISDVMGNRSASAILDGVRDAIAAATRSNASIFSIDPRGLTGIADEAIEAGIFADQRPRTAAADPESDPGTAQARPGIGTASLRSELQTSQDSLRTLADETNGFASVNSNDFSSAFERMVTANSAYYVLAYNPPSSRRDGKFHRIDVRTSRPGLVVRARRGYVAPRANTKPARASNTDISAPLLRALNVAVPSDRLKLRVFAAPFKGVATAGSVVVGVELQGADLALADNQRVELVYAAVDAAGETRAETDSFTFKLAADVKARVKQTGVRFLKRLNLPAGRYQLRIGAHDTATGAVGTVSYDLEVPDFNELPLAMSGLLVTSRDAASTVTARGDAELQKFMSAPPVSLRAFRKTDDVAAVVDVYDRNGSTPHAVDIATTVTARDGKVVFEQSDQRSSDDLRGAAGAYVHQVRVPVADLQPGKYLLSIEARSRLGQTAARQIEFDVIP